MDEIVEVTRTPPPGGQEALEDVDSFTHLLLNIDLVQEKILKYLDGSSLIHLSGVNTKIRHLVTFSKEFKKCVNMRVHTNTMDFCTTTTNELYLFPDWTAQLTNLTLVCNSEMLIFISQEKFNSLNLPNVSTLVIINESNSYRYAATLVNKILLGLSSNVKSLSLPYDFLLNHMFFDHGQNLEELKFTTSTYEVNSDRQLWKNLNFFASTCINLKSFSCQELAIVQGRYVNTYQEFGSFDLMLKIIMNNSQSLEKLEIGLSRLLFARKFSENFVKISYPHLKFLDLRAVKPKEGNWSHEPRPPIEIERSIIEILNNLPQPGELTTLKLALTLLPIELIDLISEKFTQLKSLSIKGSRFVTSSGRKLNKDTWSFLQSLTELEELEISRFIIDQSTSTSYLLVSEKFPDYLQNNNLRKLSLKGIGNFLREDSTNRSKFQTFFNGIVKLVNLKELALTGCKLYENDFMKIFKNLKLLEKLELAEIYPSIDHSSDLEKRKLFNLNAFPSLKYLKELSIELYHHHDFGKVLGSMSFPYLKSLTLVDFNSRNYELENIIRLNPMLKKFLIVRLGSWAGRGGSDGEDMDMIDDNKGQNAFKDQHTHMKIDFAYKAMMKSPSGWIRIREDSDPDSKPLMKQNIKWPKWTSKYKDPFEKPYEDFFYRQNQKWQERYDEEPECESEDPDYKEHDYFRYI